MLHSLSNSRKPTIVFIGIRAILLCALGIVSACARIEPEENQTLKAFDHLPSPADSAETRSPVYVSAEYLVKSKHDAKLTSSLEESIEKRLHAQGFQTTEDENSAASKVSCKVRTWQGYGHNTDSIAILTLGMYTPFHYPWSIETEITGKGGAPTSVASEKGKFFIYSIGTIFLHIPTAIVFSTAVPAKRRELGDNAAKMITVLLSDENALPRIEAAKLSQ